MNQIHVLLSIHNTHVVLRHESDTCITVYAKYTCFLRHESDTCITVYT